MGKKKLTNKSNILALFFLFFQIFNIYGTTSTSLIISQSNLRAHYGVNDFIDKNSTNLKLIFFFSRHQLHFLYRTLGPNHML